VSSKGYVDQLVNALPTELRYPIKNAFYYLMDTWRFGDSPRAENAQLYRYQSTTASVAGTEFSIAHGLGTAPHLIIPVLDVTAVNSQVVPLQVSRAADADRIYLKSSSTSAVFTIYAEV
jgi:hypothetical protein